MYLKLRTAVVILVVLLNVAQFSNYRHNRRLSKGGP